MKAPRAPSSLALSTALALLTGASLVAQRQPLGDGARSVTLYDVRDLLPAPITAPVGTEPASRQGSPPVAPLAELIRAFLPPPQVSAGDVSVVGDSHLVAAANAEQQAWIERFLQRARAEGAAIARVEARTIAVPLAVFARDVLPVLQGSPVRAATGGGEASTAVLLPGPATDAFLAGLRAREGVFEIAAPRLAMRLLHRASIFVGEQRSYVRDFEVELVDGKSIANPIVGVVEDGSRLECSAATLEDGTLGLVVEASIAHVERPMVEVATKLPGMDEEATIQLPRHRVVKVRAALALPWGSFALLAPPTIGEQRYLVVVRAERMVAAAAPAPRVATDELRTWTYDIDGSGVAPVPTADPGGALPARLLRCVDLVRSFIEPALASDEEVTAAGPSHLVLKARPAQHVWLRRFLAAQREEAPRRWTLRAEIHFAPRAAFEQSVHPLLRAKLRAGAEPGGEQAVVPVGAGRDALLAALGALPGASAVPLEPVSIGNLEGQESRGLLRHTRYVRDYEVEQVDGKATARPVEDVVRDGPLLQWTAASLPEGRVGIALGAVLMDLQRPIPKFTTTLGDAVMNIDLPRVTLVRAGAALALVPGDLGVLTLPAADRTQQALVLVQVETAPVLR